MEDKTTKSQANDKWLFGKYLDKEAQEAKLGIFYSIAGGRAGRPLVLPLAAADSPARVRSELMNSGADMDYLGANRAQQQDQLSIHLDPSNLHVGIYARKMGWVEGRFITPTSLRGGNCDVIVESSILELSVTFHGKAGKLADWRRQVAKPAQKSSAASFAILLALSAPLLGRVAEGEEGFIVNLAGDSSIGKTAALMAGQSLKGPGSELMSWASTSRALAEQAAALSDIFLPIDDLDKVSNTRSFGRLFTELTHMLVSGESKAYSRAVQDRLPDLKWSCVAMTGGRTTVEEMTNYRRENHERVRCIDLMVPSAVDGGIWDIRDKTDIPAQLTDELKAATQRTYGVALPRWVRFIEDDGVISRARDLRDWWVDGLHLAKADGVGHRVAKKFGLVRAAGLLAIEAGILPWTEGFVDEVVTALHENARLTLCPQEGAAKAGLEKALRACLRDRGRMVPADEQAELGTSPADQSFIKENSPQKWNVTRACFEGFFINAQAADLALVKLEEVGALTKAKDGKRGRQVRVSFKGIDKRVRMLKISGPKLKNLVRDTA